MRKFWHQFIPLTRELPNFKLWHQFCLREIIIKCLRCNQSPSCFQISNFGTYFVNGTFQYIDFCFVHGVSSQKSSHGEYSMNDYWAVLPKDGSVDPQISYFCMESFRDVPNFIYSSTSKNLKAGGQQWNRISYCLGSWKFRTWKKLKE